MGQVRAGLLGGVPHAGLAQATLAGLALRLYQLGLDPGAMDAVARWTDRRREYGIRGGPLFCTLAGGPVAAGYVRVKLKIEPGAAIVLLDAAGKQFTSQQFAHWIAALRDRGSREIVFLCGDADGFPDSLRKRAHQKISLSAMTFSHELARVMLAEQLYRAHTVLSGHPYHRD